MIPPVIKLRFDWVLDDNTPTVKTGIDRLSLFTLVILTFL